MPGPSDARIQGPPGRGVPVLAQGDVHVWLAKIDCDPVLRGAFQDVLSPDELHKAACFHFPRDRARYICARGQLRVLLGRYLGIEARRVRLRYNRFGKPYLDGEDAGRLYFNVAHTRGVALYALRAAAEVGVDIEYMSREVEFAGIARQFFSAQEYAALSALPPSLQRRAFFNAWVRKEAYVKAVGQGLSIRLSDFSVSLAPGQPAGLLAIGDAERAHERWRLQALDVPSRYVAAVATEGDALRLRCWRYPVAWLDDLSGEQGPSAFSPPLAWPAWDPSMA